MKLAEDLAELILSMKDGRSRVAFIKAVQLDAMKAGMTRFAWWKDGTQYVGTCGTTLAQAKADAEEELRIFPTKTKTL